MAVKTERAEVRMSADEKERIEAGAATAGLSTSAFILTAAIERADEVIAEATTTVVPEDYFDSLLAALDLPSPAPGLARAARRARRSGRITAK